ncbi:uncharacterized protein G2W53_025761 [Senna tora]|uniref:Uncharacterized protein n=1 Tax=Senna tora TaxID=362788 RepID=A0A834TFV7_9FABA|nr:uncharacterized protein G2W53_025761 [Senna tora]
MATFILPTQLIHNLNSFPNNPKKGRKQLILNLNLSIKSNNRGLSPKNHHRNRRHPRGKRSDLGIRSMTNNCPNPINQLKTGNIIKRFGIMLYEITSSRYARMISKHRPPQRVVKWNIGTITNLPTEIITNNRPRLCYTLPHRRSGRLLTNHTSTTSTYFLFKQTRKRRMFDYHSP